MEKGETKKTWQIRSIIFGAILLALLLLVCRLFAPFFSILLWAVLIFILLKPIYSKCVKPLDRAVIKHNILRRIIAAAFSIAAIIVILGPLLLIGFQLIRQAADVLRQARGFLASQAAREYSILEDISRIIKDISADQIIISADELRARIMGGISEGLQHIFLISGNAARNVGGFLGSLFFLLFCLYFFFIDGEYLSKLALRIVPIRKEYLKALVEKFKDITRQLVLGYFIIALAQGFVAFIIFTLFGIQGALVFAAIVFFLAFIPIIGPTLIYVPLGLMRVLDGSLWNGIFLILISSVFISTIENFLRPFILRDRIHLHPLIIFFAILGGISAFGFNGIILGPMIVIIFLTVVDLFLTEHKLEQK